MNNYSEKIQDTFRRALNSSNRSTYAICKSVDLIHTSIYSFLNGKIGLSMNSAEKLAPALKIVPAQFTTDAREIRERLPYLADAATQRILAVGDYDAIEYYLKLVEHKIEAGEFSYKRLLLAPHPPQVMRDHLCKVANFQNVDIRVTDVRIAPMLMFDNTVLMVTPDPSEQISGMIELHGEGVSNDLEKFVMSHFDLAEKY